MRTLLALLVVPFVYCQDVERVFRLTGTPDQHKQQEIVTTLRTVGDLAKVTTDPGAATVTIHAPAGQVTFAEWLVPRLDHSPANPQRFNIAGNANEVAVVYPMVNVTDLTTLQEVITTLRTVIDLRYVYNISSTFLLAFRGSASTVEKANFIMSELDRAPQAKQTAVVNHFSIPDAVKGFDTLTVYHLAYAKDPVMIQGLLTTLRSILDIQKIYNVTSSPTLTICASQSDTRVAEWLIDRLDRTSAASNVNQLQLPGGKDDVIRVVYLSHLSSASEMQSLFKSVRGTTAVAKAYWTPTPAAFIVRGTADGVEAAARVVEQEDTVR